MKTELKPCPFCGGKAEFRDYTNNTYGLNRYSIECNRCKCKVRMISGNVTYHYSTGNILHTPLKGEEDLKLLKEELIENWNRRADQ